MTLNSSDYWRHLASNSRSAIRTTEQTFVQHIEVTRNLRYVVSRLIWNISRVLYRAYKIKHLQRDNNFNFVLQGGVEIKSYWETANIN